MGPPRLPPSPSRPPADTSARGITRPARIVVSGDPPAATGLGRPARNVPLMMPIQGAVRRPPPRAALAFADRSRRDVAAAAMALLAVVFVVIASLPRGGEVLSATDEPPRRILLVDAPSTAVAPAMPTAPPSGTPVSTPAGAASPGAPTPSASQPSAAPETAS